MGIYTVVHDSLDIQRFTKKENRYQIFNVVTEDSFMTLSAYRAQRIWGRVCKSLQDDDKVSVFSSRNYIISV